MRPGLQLARHDGAAHSQRADDLRHGDRRVVGGVGQGGGLAAVGRALAGAALIGQGQDRQHTASGHDQAAEERMDNEGDDQVDRRPGDIHQGDGGGARQGGAQGVEVAHGLGRGWFARREPAPHHQMIQNRACKGAVQAQRRPAHHPVPRGVERRQGGQGEADDDGQPRQGQHAAAGHHPIIDLHHVDGRG